METLNILGLPLYHPTINLSGLILQIPYKDARRIVANLGVPSDLADKHVWQFADKGDYVLESIALEHGVTKAKNLTRRELVNMLILITAQRIMEA